MGLQTGRNSTYGPGVYIGKATIVGVQDVTEEGLPFLQQNPDVAITITLDIGKDFNPEMSFFGNFKRDERNGLVTDWGGAFPVRGLFDACKIVGEINDDGTIPQEMLDQLVGKEILRLQYVSGFRKDGKIRYSDWNNVLGGSDKPEKLAKLFEDSVAKGYPKNYSPEILSQNHDNGGDTDGDDMAIPAAPATTEVAEEEVPF
jgi:hypothetical protein